MRTDLLIERLSTEPDYNLKGKRIHISFPIKPWNEDFCDNNIIFIQLRLIGWSLNRQQR